MGHGHVYTSSRVPCPPCPPTLLLLRHHQVLGRLPKFRDYYLEQRRLQVTSDLAPPHKFLETYQHYLAQVRAHQEGGRRGAAGLT